MTGQVCVMCELAKSVDIMPVGKSLNKFGLLSKDKYMDLHKSTIHEGIKWRGLLHSLNFQENKLARLALVELVRIENNHIADQLEKLSFTGQISCVCGLRTNGPRLRRSNSFTLVRQMLNENNHCDTDHISFDAFERFPSKNLSLGGEDDWKYLSLQPERTHVESPPRLQRSRSLEILRPFVAMERGTCIPDNSSEGLSSENMDDEIDFMFSNITENAQVNGHFSADDISYEEALGSETILNSTPLSAEEMNNVQSDHEEGQGILDSVPDVNHPKTPSSEISVPDENQNDLIEPSILGLDVDPNPTQNNMEPLSPISNTNVVSVQTSKETDSRVDAFVMSKDLLSFENEVGSPTPELNPKDLDRKSSEYESMSSTPEAARLESSGSELVQSRDASSANDGSYSSTTPTAPCSKSQYSSGFGSDVFEDKVSSVSDSKDISSSTTQEPTTPEGESKPEDRAKTRVKRNTPDEDTNVPKSPSEVAQMILRRTQNKSGADPMPGSSVGSSDFYSMQEPGVRSSLDEKVTTSGDSTAITWFVLLVVFVCVVYLVHRYVPKDVIYCAYGYTFLSLVKHMDKRYQDFKIKRRRELENQREHFKKLS